MHTIVAFDNGSTRGAIAMLVGVQPDLELAGEVDGVADLLAKIKATRVPLIALDGDALGQRIATLCQMLGRTWKIWVRPELVIVKSIRSEESEQPPCGGTETRQSRSDGM